MRTAVGDTWRGVREISCEALVSDFDVPIDIVLQQIWPQSQLRACCMRSLCDLNIELLTRLAELLLDVSAHHQHHGLPLGMPPVVGALEGVGLQVYASAFEELGFTDLGYLLSMSTEERAQLAERVAMRPGHAAKFTRYGFSARSSKAWALTPGKFTSWGTSSQPTDAGADPVVLDYRLVPAEQYLVSSFKGRFDWIAEEDVLADTALSQAIQVFEAKDDATRASDLRAFLEAANKIDKGCAEAATKLLLNGLELAKHACMEGEKAIGKCSRHISSLSEQEGSPPAPTPPPLQLQATNLTFPIQIIRSMLQAATGRSLSHDAAIFVSAVLEYLTAELLELSGNAHDRMEPSRKERKCITVQHLVNAIDNDEELNLLCCSGGSINFNSPYCFLEAHQWEKRMHGMLAQSAGHATRVSAVREPPYALNLPAADLLREQGISDHTWRRFGEHSGEMCFCNGLALDGTRLRWLSDLVDGGPRVAWEGLLDLPAETVCARTGVRPFRPLTPPDVNSSFWFEQLGSSSHRVSWPMDPPSMATDGSGVQESQRRIPELISPLVVGRLAARAGVLLIVRDSLDEHVRKTAVAHLEDMLREASLLQAQQSEPWDRTIRLCHVLAAGRIRGEVLLGSGSLLEALSKAWSRHPGQRARAMVPVRVPNAPGGASSCMETVSLEALPDELLHEVDAILRATSTQGALRMRQTSKALNDRLKPLAGVLVERAWIRKVRAQQAERRTPDLVSEREREAALVEAEASLDSQVYQQEVAAAQMMEREAAERRATPGATALLEAFAQIQMAHGVETVVVNRRAHMAAAAFIRDEQHCATPAMPFLDFCELVRLIARQAKLEKVTYEATAMAALCTLLEARLTAILEVANLNAISAHRLYVAPKDFELARRGMGLRC